VEGGEECKKGKYFGRVLGRYSGRDGLPTEVTRSLAEAFRYWDIKIIGILSP
jgi:hypothetical protein